MKIYTKNLNLVAALKEAATVTEIGGNAYKIAGIDEAGLETLVSDVLPQAKYDYMLE